MKEPCNTHSDVLGHYYDTTVDPWTTTTWTSDSSGNGFGSFVVEAGYDVNQNINRTWCSSAGVSREYYSLI